MRPIAINYRSGKVYMTLWQGTEDETAFQVKCVKRGTPYVIAYGVKHELTEKETQFIRAFVK